MKKFIEDLKKSLESAKIARGSSSNFNQGFRTGINQAISLVDHNFKVFCDEHRKAIDKAFGSFKAVGNFREGGYIKESGPEFIIDLNNKDSKSSLVEALNTDWRKKYSEPIFKVSEEEAKHFSDAIDNLFKSGTDLKQNLEIDSLKKEAKNWKTLYHQERSNVNQLEQAIEVMKVEVREAEELNDAFRTNKKLLVRKIEWQQKIISQHIKNNDKLIAEVDHLHMICSRTLQNYEDKKIIEHQKNIISELKEQIYFWSKSANHGSLDHDLSLNQKQIAELKFMLERQTVIAEKAHAKAEDFRIQRNVMFIFFLIVSIALFFLIG